MTAENDDDDDEFDYGRIFNALDRLLGFIEENTTCITSLIHEISDILDSIEELNIHIKVLEFNVDPTLNNKLPYRTEKKRMPIWNDCREILPGFGRVVLFFHFDKSIACKWIDIGQFTKSGWTLLDGKPTDHVTHWMSLPEHPPQDTTIDTQ